MKRRSLYAWQLVFLVYAATPAFSQDSAQLEKVAEGQYSEWENGQPIRDSTQTWTIWRTADGFRVDDKLPPNKAAVYLAALSEEIRRNGSATTDIHLQLSKQGALQGLILNGKKLRDAGEVQVADCRWSEKEIGCKGRENTAQLKNPGQDHLVYSYLFPFPFVSIIKQSKPAANQTIPIKLAMLREVGNKLQLTEVSAQLRNEGRESLHVGEHAFETDKYTLAYDTKMGPRQITLWTSNQGTVFGMENSELAPGLRLLLSQYKKYSDF